jgi:LacI family transcriptional regulator
MIYYSQSVAQTIARRRCVIATMRDVAERAGVSVTTVSHVINETRPVSDELRRRVLTSMELLGYQPNRLARSLRRGQTHTIGMIIPDSANPFFAEMARGVEDTSFEHGYSVILCNSDGDLNKELLYTNVLTEKRVDGILFVAAGLSTDRIRDLQTQRIPLVVVDRDLPDAAVDSVLTDNAQGGWLAARHLIDLGHRRIACITGPSDVTPSAERVTGYRQAMIEAGVPVDKSLIVRGDFQYDSAYRASIQLLQMKNPPTAIFACNDLMAVAVMSAALEHGRQVPGDLSVVGFDDVRLAAFANPPLTTIVQPKYEMGVVAATMLLERMRDLEMPAHRRVLETDLVTRSQRKIAASGSLRCIKDLRMSNHVTKGVSQKDRRL